MNEESLASVILCEPERGLQAAMRTYAPIVKAILYRLLPNRPEDIEECITDVFLALWKNIAHITAENIPLKAWLIVTARNCGLNRYRALRRTMNLPLEDDVADTVREFDVVSNEAEILVSTLVQSMTPPDRDIFLRKYYLLETTREISKALQLTESNVNTRLCRGRERLRKALIEKGVHTNA